MTGSRRTQKSGVFILWILLAAAFYSATIFGPRPKAASDGDTNSSGWRIIGPGGGGAQFIPTISPHDSQTLLVACDMTGAYITHDGGRTWRQFNLRSRVDSFAFDPSNPKVIYAGSSGLYRSEDDGEHWRLLFPSPGAGVSERMVGDHADQYFVSHDNWPGGTIQSIAVDKEDPAKLFVAIKSSSLSVYYSADRGLSWRKCLSVEGRDFRSLYIDPNSPKNNRSLFVCTDTSARLLSTETLKSNLISLPSRGSVYSATTGEDPALHRSVIYLTMSGNSQDRFANSVWRSKDMGSTWQSLNLFPSALEPGEVNTIQPDFSQIACSSQDARTVYLALQRRGSAGDNRHAPNVYGILKSTDSGATAKWILRESDTQNPLNKPKGWVERDYGPEWGEAPLGLGVSPRDPVFDYVRKQCLVWTSHRGSGFI